MRLRGTLTDRGVRVLEKGFLPTFEKFGKTVQILFGPDDIYFIQTPVNTDGCVITARFTKEVLFDASTYRCESRYFNLVAFSVELSLLSRVLRGAGANDAESLEMRLVQRDVQGVGGAEPQQRPFLLFKGRGASLSVQQELPISRPHTSAEVGALIAQRDVAALSPFYLDLGPATIRLTGLTDKLRGVGDAVVLGTSKTGDLHLQVWALNIVLGSCLTGMTVFPQDAALSTSTTRNAPAEEQLQAAVAAGEAVSATVQAKHLSKVLSVGHLTQPSQILCGIAEGSTHVHVMYVFRDPTQDGQYDDSIHLSFRLPVRDD